MLAAGRELLPDARWVAGDVSQARGPADLVVASYVLGELPDPSDATAHLWRQSTDTLALDRAGDAGGLPPDPRRPRHGDRRRRPDRRALPARPRVPAWSRTTGATSRSGSPARGCTGRRRASSSATRTRSSPTPPLAREPVPRAGCADHPPAAGPLRPRQPRHLRAGRHPRAHDQPQAGRPLQGGKGRRLGRRYR